MNIVEFWNNSFAFSEEELEKELGQLREDDWKEFAPSKKLFDSVASLANNESVLDYGCGTGWASIVAAKSGCKNVTSVEVAYNGCLMTNFYAKAFGVSSCIKTVYIEEDWLARQPEGLYDAAVCSNVLDVVPTDVALDIIQNLAKVVKKGGTVVIGLNYYLSPERATERGLSLVDGRNLFINDVLRMVSYTDEEWTMMFERYFSVEKLDHFAWPGEQNETRRIFLLTNK